MFNNIQYNKNAANNNKAEIEYLGELHDLYMFKAGQIKLYFKDVMEAKSFIDTYYDKEK